MKLCVAVALAVAFQFVLVGTASAHSVGLTASATCQNNTAVISYTATSWDLQTIAGSNSQIDIRFNGITVDSKPFTLVSNPPNTFSGSQSTQLTGSVTVEAAAIGNWGDNVGPGQTADVTVTIPTDCGTTPGTGRFTGGGKQIDVGGLSITKGLTIHCDLLLSNNLEINWKGHQFHMLVHTSAICSDDPNIIQAPPAAPLDTMVGVGTGTYDGDDGFTVQFTLVDAGEPGTSDKAAFKIFETANPSNVVLDLPLTVLTGGNLQAHFDQPHKQH